MPFSSLAAPLARFPRAVRDAAALGALLLALLCAAPASHAVDTPERSGDLRQTTWTTKDGAPIDPWDMAQTDDGFLWIAGKTGLVRFDGQRFERIEFPEAPELSATPAFRLFPVAGGGLWIGYQLGGVAFVKDGRIRPYGDRDGLPGGSVTSFAQQADGTLWVGTTRGLARLHAERWETIGADWHWPGGEADTLMFDSAGQLWIRTPASVFVLRPGERTVTPVPVASHGGINFVESARGTVWLAGREGLERLGSHPPSGRARWSLPTSVFFDRDDVLWMRPSTDSLRSAVVPGAGAPARVPFDAFARPVAHPTEEWGDLVLPDRDGNVWAIARDAILRYSPRRFLSMKTVPGWPPSDGRSTMALVPLPGGELIFADGQARGAYRFDGREVRKTAFDGDASGSVAGAFRARDGSVWLGAHGLWRLADGRVDEIELPDASPVQRVRSMAEDREGGLWMAIFRKGLWRYADGAWSAKGGVAALPDAQPLVISADKAGRLWLGYLDGEVALLDGARVRIFTRADGLHVGHPLAVYGRRGTVWIGGDAGLARVDGDRVQMLAADGEDVLRGITGIVETAAGDVWVNGRSGIVRLPAAELALAAAQPGHRVWCERLDAADGIEGTSFQPAPLPTLAEADDGRLWASTSHDIYRIDPAHLVRAPITSLTLQSLMVDGQAVPIAGTPVLPVRARALRFAYRAVALGGAEKIRYRYRLDGADRDWQMAGDRTEAFFMNLPPGRYGFRVQATLAGLPWPQAETRLDVEIPPAFVQTRAFLALCVVLAAAAVWALVRWRERRFARAMRVRLEARLAERVRIARELHDTLLQSMQAVLLFVQAAARRLGEEHPAREPLEQALRIGGEGVAEGRSRILDLRVDADPARPLPDALRALAAQLQARGGASRVAVEVRGAPRALRADVHPEVHGIAREALLNAFQHARAAIITAEVAYDDDAVVVRIRDDGQGVVEGRALADGVPGHWGISGMIERARQVGGTLRLRSAPGRGTEVELRVPAALAFEAAGGVPGGAWRRWRGLLRRPRVSRGG